MTAEFGPNAGYVEELHRLYLLDPALVGDAWAAYFEQGNLDEPSKGTGNGSGNGHSTFAAVEQPLPEAFEDALFLQERATRLLYAYRSLGHLQANFNPLTRGIVKPRVPQSLNPDFYSFTDENLLREVRVDRFKKRERMPLGDLLVQLRETYCSTIGFEYMHLSDETQLEWLRTRIEARLSSRNASAEERKERLFRLLESEGFESELHRKYVGAKRFSLEGGETLIPMLDTVLEAAGRGGVEEVAIGMAHRGRLNVLGNTLKKPFREIFTEFEDKSTSTAVGAGDVKYHMGFQSRFRTRSGTDIFVMLAPNPSHLEFVNPVVEGMVRARQDIEHDGNRLVVLPVLIHGDAAIVGQGVVTETVEFSGVRGFATGGTIHLVINNQVGFTTTPDEARTSTYCTDLLKGVEAPVFHINCDDVDAACWASELAVEFRNTFGREVVLDLYCFRKYGHNEGDDPSFTQPLLYSEIKGKLSAAAVYASKLKDDGVVTDEDIERFMTDFRTRFEKAREEAAGAIFGEGCALHGKLALTRDGTAVNLETLQKVAATLTMWPEGFVPHPKVAGLLEKRVQTLQTGKGIDWGFAEALAYGSLILQGINVRMSGQDCGRGTFSHRHLLLDDSQKEGEYLPLATLSDHATFEVFNSTLSEIGVMGFEFGYSTVARDSLVLWEAQFGDFANSAQVIVDQFISSSEAKWNQRSGLVLLLPHGYEGQGPEHSSARLERFLQLCAEGNMTVCYPTTAAQQFHLLRRQGLSEIKRPLIIMTPKSLLRFPDATSEPGDFTSGRFSKTLVTDISAGPERASRKSPSHFVLCSGKVYYDLLTTLSQEAQEGGISDVRLIRLEQLYPFPETEIIAHLGRSHIGKGAKPASVTWCQEEPANMGAWRFVQQRLQALVKTEVKYAGRPESASTAVGSPKYHAREQKALVTAVVEIVKTVKEL